MSEKIGLGVVTYNRPDFLKQVLSTIPAKELDEIVIVNDGTPYDYEIVFNVIQHTTNKGVGVSKNAAIKHLLEKGCDHIFLMEDDITIINDGVFKEYIKASKATGIQHFNFSQHGVVNRTTNSTPNPRTHIEYPDCTIALYRYCIGAFSYYTKECIDRIGFMDELFYNAAEHVDHTYRVILEGMHPPYWWFADINNSEEYLKEIGWSIQGSTISNQSNHQEVVNQADKLFFKKHNALPLNIPETDIDTTKSALRTIYKNSR